MKRGGPLRRVTPLRPRSRKRQRLMPQRVALVKRLLAERPVCEVPWCPQPSTDIHEPLTRARGGSITDEANCRAVCRPHHDVIHTEPAWAYVHGFLVHSWDGDAA